jgi:hypothetical protein
MHGSEGGGQKRTGRDTTREGFWQVEALNGTSLAPYPLLTMGLLYLFGAIVKNTLLDNALVSHLVGPVYLNPSVYG